MNRSSHQRYSVKKGIVKNFTKFTGKHLCQSLFFNQVAGLRPATLLKKRLWHRCFLVNFVKFLEALFLQNTSDRLLLQEVLLYKPCINTFLVLVRYHENLFWLHFRMTLIYFSNIYHCTLFKDQVCPNTRVPTQVNTSLHESTRVNTN